MHRTEPQAGAGSELVLGQHGPRAGEKEIHVISNQMIHIRKIK
jgi:hypothetical protein